MVFFQEKFVICSKCLRALSNWIDQKRITTVCLTEFDFNWTFEMILWFVHVFVLVNLRLINIFCGHPLCRSKIYNGENCKEKITVPSPYRNWVGPLKVLNHINFSWKYTILFKNIIFVLKQKFLNRFKIASFFTKCYGLDKFRTFLLIFEVHFSHLRLVESITVKRLECANPRIACVTI